jgi:FkbM family methyltransferase
MSVPFLGKIITIPDFASFYAMYKEIFINQIYYFSKNTNLKYLIIDAGANIGISVIYFKLKYPNSKVIAVEADPLIFGFLSENLSKFGIKNDIVLINKALWSEKNIKLSFYPEGADGGRAKNRVGKIRPIYVDTITLGDLEKGKVDFLKVDVEGVELEVLKNQKKILDNTDKAFVEYHSFNNSKQNLSEVLNILKSSGLRITMINTMSNRNLPLINKMSNLDMDLQLNIFLTR